LRAAAPGIPDGPTTRRRLWIEKKSSPEIGYDAEVYAVHDKVWRKAGMEPWGGCLCISCLEKRLGRRLKPKDFVPDDPFNAMPATERLLERQRRRVWEPA
jgi:hypothetical protein